ncbi:unnamed protein product, partial [Musa acuminata var. zebrina]
YKALGDLFDGKFRSPFKAQINPPCSCHSDEGHARPLRSSPPRCRDAFDRNPNSFFGSGSTSRPSASVVSAPSPVI